MSEPGEVKMEEIVIVKKETEEPALTTESQKSDISESAPDIFEENDKTIKEIDNFLTSETEGREAKLEANDIFAENEKTIEEINKFLSSETEGTSADPDISEATPDENVEKPDETMEEGGEKSDKDDPFAYLQRNEFTSEKFKIEIRGLPRFYGIGELRALLNNRLNLATAKIKSPRARNPWAYVCFRSEDDKLRAINILDGYVWKGKKLTAKEAKPMPDPLVRKRKEERNLSPEAKRQKREVSVEDRLRKSTIPFWHIPYTDQLRIKQDEAKRILTKVGNELSFANRDLMRWLNEKKKKFDGLPCELWDLRYPTKLDGYRNKCEFTVGRSEIDGSPSVGFRFGGYATGVTTVGPFENLTHVPEPMKRAAKLFEKYVRASHLTIFDPEYQTGYFRQLTARYSQTHKQLMLVVGIHPQMLNIYEVDAFKQDIVRFFTQGEGRAANVTSLYYQALLRRLPGEQVPPSEHLYGDKYIYETILGLTLKISPEAFFQINTEAAEILYSSAIEMAKPTPESTIVDICCGTGSIGLCFANKCKQVLGLEIVNEAVMNAKENAVANNIENCQFFTGAAEDIITSVMHKAENDDIIAIVDPPRAGLHSKALEMLRRSPKLNKLIYIACNPQSACKNFVSLGRPPSKTMYGEPFVPVRAVAVDMFPYTKHLEMMIYFERWNGSNGNDANVALGNNSNINSALDNNSETNSTPQSLI